jgi:DNA-binding PadR family transcriptional regulator
MSANKDEVRKNIILELRRGVITLVVLSRLKNQEYGYTLLKKLDDLGFSVDQNTLYPLLRRLEKQGLLESEWKVEDPRPRRYYSRSELGSQLLEELKEELKKQNEILEEIIYENHK